MEFNAFYNTFWQYNFSLIKWELLFFVDPVRHLIRSHRSVELVVDGSGNMPVDGSTPCRCGKCVVDGIESIDNIMVKILARGLPFVL